MLKEIVPRVAHAALLAVEKAGFSSLAEGAKVSYEEKENRDKTSAKNLRIGYRTRAAIEPTGSRRWVFL
jgi:hypothetical protein